MLVGVRQLYKKDLFSVDIHVISPCMNSAALWYIDKPTVKRTPQIRWTASCYLWLFSVIQAIISRGTKIKSPSNIVKYMPAIWKNHYGHELRKWICVDLCFCFVCCLHFILGQINTVKNTTTLWTNSPLTLRTASCFWSFNVVFWWIRWSCMGQMYLH